MTQCCDLCQAPDCHGSGCALYGVQTLPHIVWEVIHLSLWRPPLPAGALRLLVLHSTRPGQLPLRGPSCPRRTALKAGTSACEEADPASAWQPNK